jgi:hypothetical protein
MTSQPPQDEVEEVARAMEAVPDQPELDLHQTALVLARAAIAAIDRLRSAAPAEGKDNSVAAGAAPLDLYAGPWRWIAAAPDLLEASRVALTTIEGLEGQTAKSIDGDMLRAAIAKATFLSPPLPRRKPMAEDVVERLRDFMMLCSPRGGLVLQDGIAEIERLRAELSRRSPSPDAEAARREAIEECVKVTEEAATLARPGGSAELLNAHARDMRRALSPPVEGE